MKKLILIMMFILCVSFVSSTTFINNSYNNITFTQNQNIIVNISVPRNAIYNNVTLDLEGYPYTTNYTCFQEFSNVSTICGGLNTGSYVFTNSEWSAGRSYRLYDGDYENYTYTSGTSSYFYIYYTIPPNTLNAKWQSQYLYVPEPCGLPENNVSLKLDIPPDCLYSETLVLRVRSYNSYASISYECQNITSWKMLHDYTACAAAFYEESINWTLLNSTSNLTLKLSNNDTPIWNYTTRFDGYNKVQNFSSILNQQINNSLCNCYGCTYTDYICNVPFTFHSDSPGILEYGNLVSEYTILDIINNCSISNSVPTINFSSLDEFSLLDTNITGSYNFNYYLNGVLFSYTNNFSNKDKFNVCIKEGYNNLQGYYTINYYPVSIGAGFTRTYTESDASYSNTTSFVTLYSYNNSQGDTVPFTFHVITESLGSDIPDVLVQVYRKINNIYTLVESKYTNTGGLYSGYLQQSSEYRFIFNKDGFNEYLYSTSFIESGTTITIRMQGINSSSYLPDGSVQLFLEGVSIKYLPVGTLTNNTFYNFTINVTNYQLNQTMNTGTTTLYANNGTIILGTDSCVTSDNNCFMEIKDIEVLNTFYNINSVTSVNFDVFGDSVYYNYWAVGYEYEGELSLVTTINGDLNRFLINHIDNFGRFFLGFIIMFIVIAYVIRIVNIDYTYNQLPILIFICVLTWVLSWIGFFYVDVNSTLLTEGDKKWMVTFLVTLVCIAFYLREQQ